MSSVVAPIHIRESKSLIQNLTLKLIKDSPLSSNSSNSVSDEILFLDEYSARTPFSGCCSPITPSITRPQSAPIAMTPSIPVSPMTKDNLKSHNSFSKQEAHKKTHSTVSRLLNSGSYSNLIDAQQPIILRFDPHSEEKVCKVEKPELNIRTDITPYKTNSILLTQSYTPSAQISPITDDDSDSSLSDSEWTDATESTWCVLDAKDADAAICKTNSKNAKSTFPYPEHKELLMFNRSQRCHNIKLIGINQRNKQMMNVGQDLFHDIYHIKAWKQQMTQPNSTK